VGMNERDPISEWEHAIGRRIGSWAVVGLLLILVGCLVAPIFGPMIRQKKMQKYAMFQDYEQRAEAEMPMVWLGLWSLAILAWIFVIICNIIHIN